MKRERDEVLKVCSIREREVEKDEIVHEDSDQEPCMSPTTHQLYEPFRPLRSFN
jgi:hypothetical protein